MQDEPLDANPAEVERLREQLSNLSIRVPAAHATADGEPAVEGEPIMDGHRQWLGRSWQFEDNDLEISGLTLRSQDDQTIVVIATPTGDHEIAIGNGAWAAGRTGLFPGAIVCVAGRRSGGRLPHGVRRSVDRQGRVHVSPCLYGDSTRRHPSDCGSAKRASPSTSTNVGDLHQEFRR